MKKWFYSIFFFILPFQLQAQVLIAPGLDISQFDWPSFYNPENIQNYIDFRQQTLEVGILIATFGLGVDKTDLLQLQQELYKDSIKERLTPDEIIKAQKAIDHHWSSIKDMEDQLRASVGFGLIPSEESFVTDSSSFILDPYSSVYKGVWGLYKDDYQIVFNFLERVVDEEFYQALGSDDERYAGYILPYVMDYIRKSQKMTKAYTTVLERAYENPEYYKEPYIVALNVMALRSRELYKCFIKNFQNLEGENQRALREAMTAWYNEQSLQGARGLITEYELFNTKPSIVGLPHSNVSVLVGYTYDGTPEVVREKLEPFFRAVLTDKRLKAGFSRTSAFLNALIGLKKLNALTPDEEKIFKRVKELGGIKYAPKDPDNYYSSPSTDLKEILSI